MKSRFYILAVLLFFSFMVEHVMSQDIYSTLWVKHNDNTSERIVLSEAYKGSTQFGDAVFTKFINENDRSLEYFCRMDGKKLIRYDVDKGAEYTLYDFGLDEGASFDTPDGRTMQVVEKGDTVFSEGMPTFHFLKLVNTESTDDTDIWIENYGSLYTSVLLPSELGNDVKESHLLFDWVGPLANVFRSESIQSQMMSIEKVTGYVIYDETNGNLEYIPDSLHCGFTADTLVISGRLQRAGTAFHYLSCELVNDTIRFQVDDLPDPAFTQNPKMYYFTAKFPGFKPGTYIVNYHDDNISVDGMNIEVVMPSSHYTTIPGSSKDSPEKTWILKSIDTDKNGKRIDSTHIITNFYSESVKASGLDCVDLRAPIIKEDGNIDFKHYVFWESDGTVYRYNEDNNILCKSYDFSLTQSQQFERNDYSIYEVTECGIASDYAPYWNDYYPDRRMQRMQRLDTVGDDVWIEGVGSVHTGILLPIDFESNEIYVQSMYHANNDCAFFCIDTDVFKSRPFKAEILETGDPIVEEIIQDQFNDNTTFDIEFVGDTLHVRGGLIAETRGTLKTLEAQIDNDEITLFVTEPTITRISGGVPIHLDVKIPGFNGGTYKIKYKDKNPVEVVCHGTVTSIEDYTTSDIQPERYKSNAIYDLQGRRLNKVPDRGLFIQNGKVIIQ